MIATQQSARQIRAQYYRERAAAIRLRLQSLPFEDLRCELSHLATEYERLAAYLQRASETARRAGEPYIFPATNTRNS
jgi:hypothetical protein